jgi:NAD-dependent DNA ligase
VEKNGITTIAQLEARQDEVLNRVQKLGIKYFEAIEQRIPRAEIDQYQLALTEVMDKLGRPNAQFKIVGSYRRGAATSGDIDVIVTDSQNDKASFDAFIDALIKKGLLVEILSRGKTKSLTIGQLPGGTPRRLDFMYSTPQEYAFAILYFTGSKAFNVTMRQRAIDLGYTMNEHALYKLQGKKKGPPLDTFFPMEQSIFKFLGMVYKTPEQRVDGRAVVLVKGQLPGRDVGVVAPASKAPKNVKIRKTRMIARNAREAVPEEVVVVEAKVPAKVPAKVVTKCLSKKKLRALLVQLSKEGISLLNSTGEPTLAAMILYANDSYYNKKCVVCDGVYDILKEFMERNYPGNPVLDEIGAPPSKAKVALPYFMGSMKKIKPDTRALAKWVAKYKGPYVISGKLDGISVLYTTEGGTARLFTRGGATLGMDISHMIPYLQLPDEPDITIRGELVMKKATFEKKYKGTYKSMRNMVGGLANAKKREPAKWSDLDAVCYEVIKPSLKPSAQMAWLESHGVITVIHHDEKKVSNELLSTVLVDWRENYAYEIDGIIVVDDKIYPRSRKNPDHAFAFKMVLSDQVVEAKVVDVLWTVSKDGYLNPRVQIEPVDIRGATIEFATGHNAKFIVDNKIGVGAVIRMIRSGDVIPKVDAVITPAAAPKMPDIPWKWNATHVDAILKGTEASTAVRDKNIEYFFKTIDVDGLGPGNVAKIINAGFDSVPKILAMNKADLLTVKGFKAKTADRIMGGMRRTIAKVPLPILVKATNIFGRGVGKSKMTTLLRTHPDILTSPLSTEEKVQLVVNTEGFSKKSATPFVQTIPLFLEFIRETGLQHKLQQTSAKIDDSHPLFGKRIVMTGFRDKALQERLEELGAKLTGSVSKRVFVVLVSDIDSDSGKAEEARQLGVPLMTSGEFEAKYL